MMFEMTNWLSVFVFAEVFEMVKSLQIEGEKKYINKLHFNLKIAIVFEFQIFFFTLTKKTTNEN